MSVIKLISIYDGTNWTNQKYALSSSDNLITTSFTIGNFTFNTLNTLFNTLLPAVKLSTNKLIYLDSNCVLKTTTTTITQATTALANLNYNVNTKLTTMDASFPSSKLNNKILLDWMYPIGAIYISTNCSNPTEIFGGLWEKIQDKMLVAKGTNFTAAVETSGGYATTTLSIGQIPRILDAFGVRPWGSTGSSVVSSAGVMSAHSSTYTLNGVTTTSSYQGGDKLTFTFGQASPTAINIMPPYKVVDIWHRIG